MRRFFITVLAVVIALLAILQTNYAKDKLKNAIIQRAKEKGIELSIEYLDGKLPFSFSLHKVKSDDLTINEVKGRFSLIKWGLLHFSFSDGHFKDIPLSGQMKLLLSRRTIKISDLLVESKGAGISGQVFLGKTTECNLHVLISELNTLQTLFPLPVKGSLRADLQLSGLDAKLKLTTQDLNIAHYSFAPSNISLQAEPWSEGWQGALDFEGGHEKIPSYAHLVFNFHQKSRLISFEEFTFNAPETELNGAVTINPFSRMIEGKISMLCKDLKVWRPIYPLAKWSGHLDGEIELAKEDLKLKLILEKLHFFETSAERIQTDLTLKNFKEGTLQIKGSDFVQNELKIDTLNLSSTFESGKAPFLMECKGAWRDPLELISSGILTLEKETLQLQLNDLYGFALKKPFQLKEPLEILLTADHFKLNPLNLYIGDGVLSGRMDLTPATTLIKFKGEQCPIDFLSLALPHFTMHGNAQVEVDLISWENNLQGICCLTLESGQLIPFGREIPLRARGSMQLHFEQNQVQVHSQLRAEGGQFFELAGSFPIQFHHFPFQITFDENKPHASDLTFEGRLEDLTQFINIGPQRVEGWLSGHLVLSKNNLRGEIDVQEGLYENYASGTLLQNITASGRAEGMSIIIPTLSARGRDGEGTVQASAKLTISPQFHFLLDANLNNVIPVSDHTIVAEVSGHAIIEGDSKSMTGRGDLKVDELLFLIPDHLPTELPSLPITFINPPDNIEQKKSTQNQRYPFYLDINLDAPKNVSVQGKGLNAELAGKLHISGTYTNIAADGKLTLLKGEYLFCGKVFTLSQGEIICREKPRPSASITLTGSADLADVSATVTVRGPISSPAVTFQSIPQLSTSALLARLLFNKDISEISPLQGLQLAQTLMSLSSSSGSQLDIFERMRKALHVDRLTLLTSEKDPGKISLQIGKYLMRGVLLTFVQGVSSRNVAVEVELARGFTLQAEVNETQQGKFSLKWHHYY